jgi:hypothetical protein
LEASHSGRVHHLGKVACLNGHREFESLRFRIKLVVSSKTREPLFQPFLEIDFFKNAEPENGIRTNDKILRFQASRC